MHDGLYEGVIAVEEKEIGAVTHYFGKIGVAAIEITGGELTVGDSIHIKGHTSDFQQTVESMQIEHKGLENAKPGDIIGTSVKKPVREGDKVYKIIG